MDERPVKQLTDPRALRALAHPLRLELVGLLRVHGPMTATQAAGHLGQSSGSTSFHLRQLAKYGLVEDAGGGHGRERPWRATAMFTSWPSVADSMEMSAASGLLSAVVAEKYIEWLLRWLERREDEPAEWREAAHFGDSAIYVTAQELDQLHHQEQALMDQFLERLTNPECRPPGARRVHYLHLAFPHDAPDH
jgi:predicted ArsR family transcriptional regulator